MQDDEADRVVAALRRRRVVAHVAHLDSYRFGVRIALGDGREAVWESDGGGLEAQVLRDGVLVGFVPQQRGGGHPGLDEEQLAQVIAGTDYSVYGSPGSDAG